MADCSLQGYVATLGPAHEAFMRSEARLFSWPTPASVAYLRVGARSRAQGANDL